MVMKKKMYRKLSLFLVFTMLFSTGLITVFLAESHAMDYPVPKELMDQGLKRQW